MSYSQARRSNRRLHSSHNNKNRPIQHGLREIVLIFFCFVGLYLFVSLLTYYGDDPGWSHSGDVEEVRNKGGVAGALFADIFFHLFGYFAYLFPMMVGYMGWLIYQGRHHDILAEPKTLIVPGIGFVLTLSAGCGLAIVHFMAESALLPSHAGGILGMWIGDGLVSIVDRLGATLILLAIFFTGITLLTGLSWLKLMDTLGYHTLLWLPIVRKYMGQQFLPWFHTHAKQWLQIANQWLKIFFHKLRLWTKTGYTRWQERRSQWHEERTQYYDDIDLDEDDDDFFTRNEPNAPNRDGSAHPVQKIQKIQKKSLVSASPIHSSHRDGSHRDSLHIKSSDPSLPIAMVLPALNLLEPMPNLPSSSNAKMLSQRMKDAFAALRVEVEINAVEPGPVLSRFEVKTITPINTNHLDELGEALTEVLKVEPVKVVEDKPEVLEVEMPNFKRQTIYLSCLLNTPEYQNNPSPLTLALGQDVSGQSVVVDLIRIPHILIAGSDPAEKTMAINVLILSLLYKSTPEAVRFLLIDSSTEPSRWGGLSVYTDLPHLLTPVINDLAQVPQALRWCVQEMEHRYRLMAHNGVRNIDDYNQALQLQNSQTELEDNTDNFEAPLFYIVIIINEIADFLKVDEPAQVEQYITRLTQKARAAGIYIVLATQYPTVNVITGLIKANIPTRMAFQVNSASESRNILGQIGAETLLGQGDMLYMTAGTGMPVRVHGSFVSDSEVENVVTELKSSAMPDYIF